MYVYIHTFMYACTHNTGANPWRGCCNSARNKRKWSPYDALSPSLFLSLSLSLTHAPSLTLSRTHTHTHHQIRTHTMHGQIHGGDAATHSHTHARIHAPSNTPTYNAGANPWRGCCNCARNKRKWSHYDSVACLHCKNR